MYRAFYGLKKRPFENTPDAAFLYHSPLHREILAAMLYGIENSKGFILVTGDVGTGKTTLINALLAQISSRHTVVHIVNPRVDFGEVVDYLAAKLGLKRGEENLLSFMETVKERLIQRRRQGTHTVLLIDEAHLLDDGTLENIRLLSNLETPTEKLLQILLVGQTELQERLKDPALRALRQRIVLNRGLTGLSLEETREYIHHRLHLAGVEQPDAVFSSQAVDMIYQHSSGIPRIINSMCDNALLIGYARGEKVIEREVIAEVIQDLTATIKGFTPRSKAFHPLKALKERYPGGWARPVLGGGVALLLIAGLAGFLFLSPDEKQETSRPNSAAATTASVTTPVNKPQKEELLPLEPQDGEKGSLLLPLSQEAQEPAKDETITPRGDYTYSVMHARADERVADLIEVAYGQVNDAMLDLVLGANPGLSWNEPLREGQLVRLPHYRLTDMVVQSGGEYYIYYGSFRFMALAKEAASHLQDKGYDVRITEAESAETLLLRLYTGPFASKEEAVQLIQKISFDFLPFS